MIKQGQWVPFFVGCYLSFAPAVASNKSLYQTLGPAFSANQQVRKALLPDLLDPRTGNNDTISILPADESQLKILEEMPENAGNAFLRKSGDDLSRHQWLGDFSITLDRSGQKVSKQHQKVGRHTHCINPTLMRNVRYYPLTRPGEQNFVAVVRTEIYRTAALNPIRGFNYGPIPLLQDLTLAEADQLWGKFGASADLTKIERHYKLESTNKSNHVHEFELLCVFKDGHLSNYKVIGPMIDSPQWGPMYFVN